jgi:ABC-type nickel/cobalt efflux system permease component RcnA
LGCSGVVAVVAAAAVGGGGSVAVVVVVVAVVVVPAAAVEYQSQLWKRAVSALIYICFCCTLARIEQHGTRKTRREETE